MMFQKCVVLFMFLAGHAQGFVSPKPILSCGTSLAVSSGSLDDDLANLTKQGYAPGKADTELARRFGSFAADPKPVRTVGDTLTKFTKELGYSINALYKNYVSDTVASTHRIVVNARFERDPIWSLGFVASIEMLLRNYPEKNIADQIASALFKAIEIDEGAARSEAESLLAWAEGKTLADIEAAVSGEGDSVVAQVARKAKEDKYWLYSKYFSVGLVKLMEKAGVEMDKDEVYPIMQDWMSNRLGKSYIAACSHSDRFFKLKEKLDMMETLMKEVEIREKKRMAERLERKAEEALLAAEKEAAAAAAVDVET